jgi:hypothetical protein
MAQGSDNWPITWAADGHQYTSWGDGKGFERKIGYKASLGYSRIEGSASSYLGRDLFYGAAYNSGEEFEGKSIGILSVGGILYSWITPGSGAQAWQAARLYKSTDRGKTWRNTGVEFTSSDGFGKPWIMQAGKEYGKRQDNYVYHYFIEIKSGNWQVQRPGQITLLRVPISAIQVESAYEFFAGLDAAKKPVWTKDQTKRKPAIADPNGLLRGSTTYVPDLDRFITIINHTMNHSGNLAIFDAPDPWGPWTTVAYVYSWSGPNVPPNTFLWLLAPKWFSSGLGFVMVFTGVDINDSWNTVAGRFIRRPT